MKASSFSYVRAESLEDVFDLQERYGEDAKILAGGQSLLPSLHMRLMAPAVLVDINRIGRLSGISVGDGVVRIGALTPHVDVEHSSDIARLVPMVAQAMPHIAHYAIRNRGTIGGSLAHADPAAELPACAVALGARLELTSRRGTRTVSATDFFETLFTTSLEPDEVLTTIEIPTIAAGCQSVFLELARRHGDYAMVGLAAHGRMEEGMISDLTLVFFGVEDRPVIAAGAATTAIGNPCSRNVVQQIQDALCEDLDPSSDLQASAETKLYLARILAARAVRTLADGTSGAEAA